MVVTKVITSEPMNHGRTIGIDWNDIARRKMKTHLTIVQMGMVAQKVAWESFYLQRLPSIDRVPCSTARQSCKTARAWARQPPNGHAPREVLMASLNNARITSSEVCFIEAHGTALDDHSDWSGNFGAGACPIWLWARVLSTQDLVGLLLHKVDGVKRRPEPGYVSYRVAQSNASMAGSSILRSNQPEMWVCSIDFRHKWGRPEIAPRAAPHE
jgi:hypothetical protein